MMMMGWRCFLGDAMVAAATRIVREDLGACQALVELAAIIPRQNINTQKGVVEHHFLTSMFPKSFL